MRLGINSLFCCSLCGLFLSYAVAAQVARGGFQYRPSSLHTALQELESPAAAMRDSAVDSVAARRSPPAITLARIRMKQSNAPVGVVIIEMTVPDFSEHLYESRVEDPLIGVGANREWAAFDAFGESGVGGRKARKRGLSPAAARYPCAPMLSETLPLQVIPHFRAALTGERNAKPLRIHASETTTIEVSAPQGRRQFSASEKKRILVAADACAHGELGAFLRKQGIYLSIDRLACALPGAAGLTPATRANAQARCQGSRDSGLEQQVKKLEKELGIVNGVDQKSAGDVQRTPAGRAAIRVDS